MVYSVNFKLVKLSDPAQVDFFKGQVGWAGGAIETPFLTKLIFTQFEANLAQSNFEHKFFNVYKQKFLFIVCHFKQSVRIRAKLKFETTVR